jgi:glutamate racemase
MMQPEPSDPIGIFDSGLGGLTVASSVLKLLPQEQIIYFGDTAHLPYGDKSAESVSYYAVKISEFFLKHNCKVILIACNTASAVAYNAVKDFISDKALVIDVINPVIDLISRDNQINKPGVIGTKRTIHSSVYQHNIESKRPGMQVQAMATPLLVPMIEEGFIYDDISNAIIRSYLSREEFQGLDSLILGCTHYPIIKNQIRKYYNFKVKVIDSSHLAASYLKEKLQEKKLLSTSKNGEHQFFVSDYSEMFIPISQMFFDDTVNLEKIDFWK